MMAQSVKINPMFINQVAAFGGGGHALRPKEENGRIKVTDHM